MATDKDKEQVFREIYENNTWGDNESKSGPGSNLEQTKVVREELPKLLSGLKIATMLDVPCGDFHWMKLIQSELSQVLKQYIGGDVVEEVIAKNLRAYGNEKFKFTTIDLTAGNLPKVDLIFSRDVLVHFSYHEIYKALRSIKASGAKYLLTTSFIDDTRKNRNIITGYWRPINLQKFPFYFPAPSHTLVEKCTENDGQYSDKSLLLWDVSRISLVPLKLYLLASRIRQLLR